MMQAYVELPFSLASVVSTASTASIVEGTTSARLLCLSACSKDRRRTRRGDEKRMGKCERKMTR